MDFNMLQDERMKKVLDNYSKIFSDRVDENGKIDRFWNDGDTVGLNIELRSRLYIAYALLFEGKAESIKKSNTIIRKSIFKPCHFAPMVCTQLILKHKDKLDDDNKKIIMDYLKESLELMIDNKEYEFVGVNDNFPCMACFTGIVAGKMLNNEKAVSWGIKSMNRALKMLERRGLPSEHTSPTYSAIQILAVAEIANYTKDENVRKKAIELENRLALSVLAFYHPGMGKMAGPYSRAYAVDSAGEVHLMDYWLYTVLGERTISAIDETFASKETDKIFHGSQWFVAVQFVWLAACRYHISEKIISDAIYRKFPYEVKASCEFSSSCDDLKDGKNEAIYAAGENQVSCYMTEEYAVGVSRIPFHNGIQTDSFYLLCKKKEKVEHTKDIQPVFVRYIINDTMKTVKCLQWDRGRKIGVQNKNIGFLGYRPTGRVVGEKVSSMKLSVVIPAVYGKEINIVRKDNSIYVKLHNTFVAFYLPDKEKEIRVEEYDDCTLISVYDYLGKEKVLTAENYKQIINGFAFAVDHSDVCAFEEFVKRPFLLETDDYKTSHSRQTLLRNAVFEYNNEKSVELEYDVECCGIKYSLADGKANENVFFSDTENGVLTADKIRGLLYE